MSELRRSSVTMPVAALGPENPLPPLRILADPRGGLDVSEADTEMTANLAYGHPDSLLPYTFQDGYGRETVERELATAVLENDILRAEFLLDYGGRLKSLLHKPSGRELLHFPSKLQLANLGLRNAWFAGGVEWNLGTFGHTALGCTPVHAVRLTRPDGAPVLRLYEFERMRRLVYQLDFALPPGSPVLLVHGRIHNPNTEDAPVYYWSNAAVRETPGTRVLTPSTSAFHFSYTGRLRRIPFPRWRDDASYPGRVDYGADYFQEIPDGERRWIAALDEGGVGLAQASTDNLRGRKLFHWGTGSGGRNWQDWLSGPGRPYCEIQAGLARTQLEHLRIPARGSWSWLEAYGRLAVDPEAVHGKKWDVAVSAAATALEQLVPREVVDAELATMGALAGAPPEETLHAGTGWGALERRALRHKRDRSLELPGTPFPDDTIGRDQQSWLALVRKGEMPTPAPALPPSSFAVGPVWRQLLEKSTRAAATWFTLLHLGVNYFHAGEFERARDAWNRSLAEAETSWALRNLAMLDEAEGDRSAAADRYLRAWQLSPRLRPLTVETVRALIAAGRPGVALEIVDKLGPADRWAGRVLLLECRAALDADDLVRARRILETGLVVEDMREGEDPLSALWWEFQERRAEVFGSLGPAETRRVREEHPLPCSYDYSVRQI